MCDYVLMGENVVYKPTVYFELGDAIKPGAGNFLSCVVSVDQN